MKNINLLKISLVKAVKNKDGYELDRAINDWFQDHIEEYSSMCSVSTQLVDAMRGKTDSYLEYQVKQVACEMANMAIKRGTLSIEKIDPEEEYENTGKFPDWAYNEERRLAKLWVLK